MGLKKLKSSPLIDPPKKVASATIDVHQVRVHALSKQHARQVAAAMLDISDALIIGVAHDMVVAADPARCDVEDYPTRGARRWVQSYAIYTYAERVSRGRGQHTYLGVELVRDGFEDKVSAVKAAKKESLDRGVPMMVQLHKQVDDQSDICMVCEPKVPRGTYIVRYVPKL